MRTLYETNETPEMDGIYYIDIDGKFIIPTFLCNRWSDVQTDLYVRKIMSFNCTTVHIMNNWIDSLFPQRPDYVLLDIKSKSILCYELPNESYQVQLVRKGMPNGILPSQEKIFTALEHFIPNIYCESQNAPWRYWLNFMLTSKSVGETQTWYDCKLKRK